MKFQSFSYLLEKIHIEYKYSKEELPDYLKDSITLNKETFNLYSKEIFKHQSNIDKLKSICIELVKKELFILENAIEEENRYLFWSTRTKIVNRLIPSYKAIFDDTKFILESTEDLERQPFTALLFFSEDAQKIINDLKYDVNNDSSENDHLKSYHNIRLAANIFLVNINEVDIYFKEYLQKNNLYVLSQILNELGVITYDFENAYTKEVNDYLKHVDSFRPFGNHGKFIDIDFLRDKILNKNDLIDKNYWSTMWKWIEDQRNNDKIIKF